MSQRKTPQGYQEIELLAAMAEEGCPICHHVAGSDARYFFWFFNETYYESFTLDALTRSLGFCLTHGAHVTRTSAGSYQLAAVHEVLVRRIRARLSRYRAGRIKGERPGSTLAPNDRCPACRDREEGTEGGAFWLAKLLDDPAGADRYARPGMLCYPHLGAVTPRVSAHTLDRLLTTHEAAMVSAMESLAKLRAELSRDASDGRQDLVKALLPALRLAVGHDTGDSPYPSLHQAQASSEKKDPVGDLLEGLRRGDACPVCLEVRRAWLEWFGWLDHAPSRVLHADDLLPTCPEHVWSVVDLGGAFLAVATAEQALGATLSRVSMAVRLLKPTPPPSRERPVERLKRVLWGPRHRLRAAREVLAHGPRCPVCERLAVARDRILSLLFALLEDRQHLATVESSYGLCLKHFSRALALDPSPEIRRVLIDVETSKLTRLQWELEESLRKGAWNWRPEAIGTEGTAWRRAVLRFSGSLTGEPN